MARRRYQQPTPQRVGRYWWIRVWTDEFTDGIHTRKLKRIRLAEASTPEREVKKIAAEYMASVNRGLISAGSGTNFMSYVAGVWKTSYFPQLAAPVRKSYQSMVDVHLEKTFGNFSLNDIKRGTLQGYFANCQLNYPTMIKVRDVLSSILRSAVVEGYLTTNPLEKVNLPPDRRPRRQKNTLTPQQFGLLLEFLQEPYSTLVYVATLTGLRISELLALTWRCVKGSSISVEARFCRGDLSCPKTNASAATIEVAPEVITRINSLKNAVVSFKAGRAIRNYPAVRASGDDDLVFQSPLSGTNLSDGNVLRRHLKPAGQKLGIPWINWQVLRRSFATWNIHAGNDVKTTQGLMRHAKATTTLEIYSQIVRIGQKSAVEKLAEYARLGACHNMSQKTAQKSVQ
jgi:integrase